MSHFAEEFERQLVKTGQSVDDLVVKSNLTRSQLYLWRNGQQTSITDAQLCALATALSPDVGDNAELVRAHLLDEKFGPGSDLVHVEIDHPGVLHDQPRPRSKGERAMAFLAEERVKNRDLNELLIDLARVLGAFNSGRVSTAVGQISEEVVSGVKQERGSPERDAATPRPPAEVLKKTDPSATQ